MWNQEEFDDRCSTLAVVDSLSSEHTSKDVFQAIIFEQGFLLSNLVSFTQVFEDHISHFFGLYGLKIMGLSQSLKHCLITQNFDILFWLLKFYTLRVKSST